MSRASAMCFISTSTRRRRIELLAGCLPFRNAISHQGSQGRLDVNQYTFLDNLRRIRHDIDRIIPTSRPHPPSHLPAFVRIINMFVRAPIRWVALALFAFAPAFATAQEQAVADRKSVV